MTKTLFNLSAGKPAPKSAAEIFLDAAGARYERDVDGVIVVLGTLYLNDRNLTELPDLSNVIVEGSFHAENNQLTTLKGAPREVTGGYYVQNNRLTTLEGAPEEIHAAFDCRNNLLASLEHGPRRVAALFWCAGNKLTSLDGAPESVGGTLGCENNPLESLYGLPERHNGIISDLGNFAAGEEIPPLLRTSAAQREKMAEDATVLRREMPVSKPLAFRAVPSKTPLMPAPEKPLAAVRDQAPKPKKRVATRRDARRLARTKGPGPVSRWIGKKMFPYGFAS